MNIPVVQLEMRALERFVMDLQHLSGNTYVYRLFRNGVQVGTLTDEADNNEIALLRSANYFTRMICDYRRMFKPDRDSYNICVLGENYYPISKFYHEMGIFTLFEHCDKGDSEPYILAVQKIPLKFTVESSIKSAIDDYINSAMDSSLCNSNEWRII